MSSKLNKPSRASFEALAEADIDCLLDWIEEGSLLATDLTFAAEIAGSHSVTANEAERYRVTQVLLRLLDHPKAYVHEGALLGLEYHFSPNVRRVLTEYVSDESKFKATRELAQEMLDGHRD